MTVSAERLPRRADGLGQERRGPTARAAARACVRRRDAEIEHRTGVDIAYIFEREGEAGFRRARGRRHRRALTAPRWRRARDRRWRRARSRRRASACASGGRVVYLRTSVDQQLTRTRHGSHRPLLAQPRSPRHARAADGRARTALRGHGHSHGRHRRPQGQDRGSCSTRLPADASATTRPRDRAMSVHRRALRPCGIALGERSYPISIGTGLLDDTAAVLAQHDPGPRRAGRDQRDGRRRCTSSGCATALAGKRRAARDLLPDGEQYKTLASARADLRRARRGAPEPRCLRRRARRRAWSATWRVSPPPVTSAASTSCRCRRRCWHRSIHPSAARRASTIPAART